jgi:1-deoxy-D-xylulose-5-phosphate reductoisomerase
VASAVPTGAGGVRPKRVIVLGSTGSIGTQTLDVIDRLNAAAQIPRAAGRFEVVGIAAGLRADLAMAQAARYPGCRVAMAGGQVGDFRGADAAERLVRNVECDIVVAAIVGAAGLRATLAAIELGRDVALANKETLVAAGALVVPAASRSGSKLLPVDSEHCGLWQCLGNGAGGVPPFAAPAHVRRVLLTASGGPFRTWTREQIIDATPEQALRHPTWSMGSKVTVDSASLMNKGLELIEAHWLFGLEPERLGAVVHPQSIVHAIVEHADGSWIAQLASPDMRGPIQHALSWPQRVESPVAKLAFAEAIKLEFEPPDPGRFPALGLAFDAMRAGGTAGAILNAANEEAVQRFLAPATGATRLAFGRISELVRDALREIGASAVTSLADVERADAAARAYVREATR